MKTIKNITISVLTGLCCSVIGVIAISYIVDDSMLSIPFILIIIGVIYQSVEQLETGK